MSLPSPPALSPPQGTSLLVTFPTGYIDPLEAERNVEAAERELRDFRSGKDESPMFEAAKAVRREGAFGGAEITAFLSARGLLHALN